MCAGSPACCFRSLTRSAFDALSAGPRLNNIVAKRQKRNVTARTEASGFIFNTIEKFIEVKSVLSEWRSRPLLHRLKKRPNAPPTMARRRPSHKSCRMMRQRLAPRARRKAISLARAVPRARSMFARFKLAMSNTAAAMPMRRAPITVTGPSSEGVVLMLKREGVCICSSRAPPLASAGCRAVRRCASTGSRGFAESIVRPDCKRATTFSV